MLYPNYDSVQFNGQNVKDKSKKEMIEDMQCFRKPTTLMWPTCIVGCSMSPFETLYLLDTGLDWTGLTILLMRPIFMVRRIICLFG